MHKEERITYAPLINKTKQDSSKNLEFKSV